MTNPRGQDSMQERRQHPEPAILTPELVVQATRQLEREIRLIEGWLAELEETSKDNREALAARKSYDDMIQSRRDLLQTLQKTP
jgi:hypothetical protein